MYALQKKKGLYHLSAYSSRISIYFSVDMIYSYFLWTLLRPATKLWQCYVFMRVCDSVYSGGSASVHAGIDPPGADPPEDTRKTPQEDPSRKTPPRKTSGGHPQEQCMLGDMGNKWAVRILLKCILVCTIFWKETQTSGCKKIF